MGPMPNSVEACFQERPPPFAAANLFGRGQISSSRLAVKLLPQNPCTCANLSFVVWGSLVPFKSPSR